MRGAAEGMTPSTNENYTDVRSLWEWRFGVFAGLDMLRYEAARPGAW